MTGLSEAGQEAHARLEAKHAAREAALRLSRASTRASANAIRAAHRADWEDADTLMGQAAAQLADAIAAAAGHSDVRWAGFIHDAEKELVEARATTAVLRDHQVPTAGALGVSDAAWLNGLAETVGELRRHLLDQLRHARLERCEALLEVMDDIYTLLVTIDFPDGVTGGLRRSTDVARSILERTRGDYTTALLQDRLRDALDAHRRDMLEG